MTQDKETKRNPDDAFLEEHFRAARQSAHSPGNDLVQRILADATKVQSALTVQTDTPTQTPPGGIKALLQALGGWPAAASLSSAAAVGLWIGVAPPDALTLIAQDFLPAQADGTSDADGGFDFLEEML